MRNLTEIAHKPDLPLFSAYPERERPHPGWLRVPLAGVLSGVFPGLGQLYNRESAKAIWMAASIPGLLLLIGLSHILLTLAGLIASIVILIGCRLAVIVDALRKAWRRPQTEDTLKLSVALRLSVGLLVVVLGTLPTPERFLQYFSYFRTYRMPSDSMCPAACEDEKFVADMRFYQNHAPQRGDVVLFERGEGSELLMKRIIGVAGDVLSGSKEGQIFSNGTLLQDTSDLKACGKPVLLPGHGENESFGPVKVPEGALFVMGDNTDHSYDSRAPGYGFVKLNRVRGKPLYIYSSPGISRINRKIR